MEALVFTTPLGDMIAAGEGEQLRRLDFLDSRYAPALSASAGSAPVLLLARDWTLTYLAGERPPVPDCLAPAGSPFARNVWELLREIPYGRSVTYGDLARELAARTGRRGCAQAVGQAVGRNPISLMIPCHRVLGAGNTLTGYGGGLWRKRALLELEGIVYKP